MSASEVAVVTIKLVSIGTLGYFAAQAFGGSSRKPKPKPTPTPTPDPGTGGVDVRPRELDDFGVPFARGSADPLWPLADASARRVTADFGDPRPYGAASPERHHAGEDLRAPAGTTIVATERGTVTAIDEAWYEGTGALLVYFDSGITANFGEVEPSSPLDLGLAVGTVVERGQPIARVGRTAQLHFELYNGRLKRTHQWPWLGEAPAELLDPTQYLELAAKSVPA
jgi:murein DD-endopeptidase MepM/ murein hydrolase activator NlpD